MGWKKWNEIPTPNMTRDEFIAVMRGARKHIRFEPLLGEPLIIEFAWEEWPAETATVDLDDMAFDLNAIGHRVRVPGKPPSASTGEADESFTAEAK